MIDEYDLVIQAKESEISALETQETEQYQKFYAQVRWLEETGSASYISILFQAHSFSEMLDYAMLIADIMDYSNGIICNLERLQTELKAAQKELQESRYAQATAQEGLYDQIEKLEIQKQEALKLYDEIAQVEADLAAEAKRLATDEAHMSQELKAAEKQYADQIAQLNNKGEWYWPLPGYYGITSYFGGRIHPIYGNWESHTGTDVPAPGGTEIHAAQDGVVTVSKYNVSYGNYCVISHSDSYATLYAHMKTLPVVKVGDTVSKGQVIGYVGSTGDSTGNHLHYELRVNGVRDNALRLYPNIKFIDKS